MKLISMTEFVLEQVQNAKYEEFNKVNETFVNKVVDYANFLNQPLTLGMFIPCDENGNLLEIPQPQEGDDGNFNYQARFLKYQQAKDKVLFEGFGIENEKFFDVSFYDVVRNRDTYVFVKDKEWEKVNDYNTIEDLVLYQLPLTPNAIKQLKL